MYRYTTISFPGLGIEFDPIREFSIGPVSVHLYGLIIGIGMNMMNFLPKRIRVGNMLPALLVPVV